MVRALRGLTLSGTPKATLSSIVCYIVHSFIPPGMFTACAGTGKQRGWGRGDSLVSGMRQAESGSKSLSWVAAHAVGQWVQVRKEKLRRESDC